MTTVASRQVRILLLMLATAFPLSAVAPEKNEAVVAQTLTQRVQNFKQNDIEVLAGMAQAGTLPVVYPQENVRVQALLFDAMATIDGLLALAKQNQKYEAILDQFLNTFTGVAREVPKMDRSAVQALRDKTAACVTDLGEAAVRSADRGAELANNLYLTMARALQPQAFSNGNLFKAFARKWKGFTKVQKAATVLVPVIVASAIGVGIGVGVKHHNDKKAIVFGPEDNPVARRRERAERQYEERAGEWVKNESGCWRTVAERAAEAERVAEAARLVAEDAANKIAMTARRFAFAKRVAARQEAEAELKAQQDAAAEEAARQAALRAERQPVEGVTVKMTFFSHGSPSAPHGSPMRGRREKLIARSNKSEGTPQELAIGAIRNAGRHLQDIDRGEIAEGEGVARDALLGFFSDPAWARDNLVDATLRNVFAILRRDPVTGAPLPAPAPGDKPVA